MSKGVEFGHDRKHHLITGHWCISLTDTRQPNDDENGCQGTECNQRVQIKVLISNTRRIHYEGALIYSQYFDGDRTYQ